MDYSIHTDVKYGPLALADVGRLADGCGASSPRARPLAGPPASAPPVQPAPDVHATRASSRPNRKPSSVPAAV